MEAKEALLHRNQLKVDPSRKEVILLRNLRKALVPNLLKVVALVPALAQFFLDWCPVAHLQLRA